MASSEGAEEVAVITDVTTVVTTEKPAPGEKTPSGEGQGTEGLTEADIKAMKVQPLTSLQFKPY